VSYFIDDNSELEYFLDYKVKRPNLEYEKVQLLITIGDNEIRKKVANSLIADFGIFISKEASICSDTVIGVGSQIIKGAILQPSVVVGDHTIINTKCSVDHDCVLGNFCHVAPGTTICGDVSVGNGTFIGAGATVIQGITIGHNVTIGAGAVVINDIPDNAVAVGNPAKVIKINE
jgi:sugar O-acyltransferase (sialic acid O-acetyltransferase NeuD family)